MLVCTKPHGQDKASCVRSSMGLYPLSLFLNLTEVCIVVVVTVS